MAINTRIHTAKAYAIVSPAGKIQVDTVSTTKGQCGQYLSTFDVVKGRKIMRVSVVVEMKQ